MSNYDAATSSSIRGFSTAVSWAAFLTFDLIVLGSLVRATDSGLSCPDWPLCYDQVLPAMDMHIFVEWLHRASALLLGGVLTFLVYKLVKHPPLRKVFGSQLYAGVGLFLLQCALGGLTVLKLLNPTVVSLHLINAVLFYSLLLWAAFRARGILSENRQTADRGSAGTTGFFSLFTAVVFLQLLLGAMVSSNHAGLVCSDFPKCQGQWFPGGSYLFTLQMTHRLAGFSILIFGVVANVLMRAVISRDRNLRLATRLLVTLILLQLFLGMVNIFYALPTWASVLHMGNGLLVYTLVFLTTLNVAKIGHRSLSKTIDEHLHGQLAGRLPREEMVT
jgi:cytochrome c oxidase assembly protein subunit 15